MLRTNAPYLLFSLVVSIATLIVLGIALFVDLDPDTRAILNAADLAVCALFFVDFLGQLFRAPNRWRYFYTWGWLDLLSAIPMIDALRWGRLGRIVRLVAVLRALRSLRVLLQFVNERRIESSFLVALLLCILLLCLGSIGILHFEQDPQSNIKTANDAMWWAISTMTTVGYGDRFPVTGGGRVVAVILMTAGVGIFATVSGALAAWFLRPAPVQTTATTKDTPTDVIAERTLMYSLPGAKERKPLNIRVYAPFVVNPSDVSFHSERGTAGCRYELVGLPEGIDDVAYGADTLQALQLAAGVEGILRALSNKYELYFLSGEGYFDA